MTKRTWMIEKRESMGLSREQAAKLCNPRDKRTHEYLHNGQVSARLIEILEQDDTRVTHPDIAARICNVYGIRKKALKLSLIPLNYRPGPDYNPDRYKAGTDYRFFVAEEDK